MTALDKVLARDEHTSNTCLRCNGAGKVWITGQHRVCPSCEGTGKSKRSYIVHDAVARDGVKGIAEAGWGCKGGSAGQDFKRLSKDTPCEVVNSKGRVGGEVWVKFDDNPYNWSIPVRAIRFESGAPAKDSAAGWAALLAALYIWATRDKETVGPEDYDLRTYRPKRKSF